MESQVTCLTQDEIETVGGGMQKLGAVLMVAGAIGISLALAPEAAAAYGIIVGADALGASVNLSLIGAMIS